VLSTITRRLFYLFIPFYLGNEQITTKNHPLSCYTSRKIDYSAKINEILTREELSSKFMKDERKEINNETTLLSESLGKKNYTLICLSLFFLFFKNFNLFLFFF
jgi:hypothetical protein